MAIAAVAANLAFSMEPSVVWNCDAHSFTAPADACPYRASSLTDPASGTADAPGAKNPAGVDPAGFL
jgi:hypothetical protein